MHVRPIRTADDYREALRQVSIFFANEPEPESAEGDVFEVLLTLIEAYEARRFPLDLPDRQGPAASHWPRQSGI